MAEQQNSTEGTRRRSEDERDGLVLEANQDGVFDINLLSGESYFSPEWLCQIGYLPDELPCRADTWRERIHAEEREAAAKGLDDYLTRRRPTYQLDYRMRHRDGHWRWVHARGKAIWDEAGRAVRLVGSHRDITESKQAETELKISEARLRLFLDNNPAVSFIKDEEGRMVYTNASLCKLFGLERDAWLGKQDAEIWPLDVAAELRATDLRVLASESSIEILERVPLPDGTVREFLSKKFCFRDASGRKALGGIALDLTDHRRTEAALRISEARNRELFERNPVPGWIYGTDDFRIVDVNRAAIEHYGWSREEFLSMTVHDIRIADEFAMLEEHLKGAPTPMGKSPLWHHQRKDGSTIFVELMALDLKSAGAPLRLTLANDVTARVQAEAEILLTNEMLESLVEERTKELRESKLRFQALVEASPQMIWATGPEGETDFLNPRAIEYTGMPCDELGNHNWLRALHPDDVAGTGEAWKTCLESGKPYNDEYRLRSKDGEYRWFHAQGRPVRNAEGQIVRWVGTCTDIQDQKQSEEILEAAVASRTLELAEARDRAEAATQAKSSFLAAMSHEIRTPMNGVIAMADLMLETELTSEQRCYMDTIRSSGDALLTVINDILDLSKIEAGRLTLETAPFDLSTLVEEAFEVIGAQAVAKELKLFCQVDEGVPLDLLGDAVRLRQVILNLLSNAVKFTSEGSVSLLVSQEATQSQFTTLRFAVRDTGIGLTRSQQEHLFGAFQQAELSTARRFGGTGLGLNISKRLVEKMGGAIGVHSIPGEGSTFFFNVCLEMAPAPVGGESLGGRRVALICENDATAANLISHLTGVGLRVTRHARALRTGHLAADLVLVDASAIANRSIAAQFFAVAEGPVIVLGAKSDFSFPLPADKSLASFVEKPVRRLPLLRAVQSAFEGSTADAAVSRPVAPVPTGRAQVLLAEDNKVNQLVAKILLERMGCRVDIVENGMAACRAVQNGAYDLVLMDCQMPMMNGFEATERIRGFEKSGRRTPIIALTAGVLQGERERCYASGMDDFVGKPISSKELGKAVERWIVTMTKVN